MISFGTALSANAQIGDTGDFLRAGKEDANALIGAYLNPYLEGFGLATNTGWIGTAKAHSLLGFDVSIRAGMALVPEGERTFDLSALGLQRTRVLGSNTITQTVAGKSESGPRLQVYETIQVPGSQPQDLVVAEFDMPGGTGFPAALAPSFQIGLGIPYDTDILIRYVPTVNIGDMGSVGLVGFGVKHQINQWFPVPFPIDISIFGGFSTFKLSANLDVRPGSPSEYDNNDPNGYDTPSNWDGQSIDLSTNSFNMGAIAGKSFGPLLVYGGLGFKSATTKLGASGNYPVIQAQRIGNVFTGQRELSQMTDPLDIKTSGDTQAMAMAGLQLKLLILTFNIDYTIAEYNILSAGVGISIR